MDNVARIANRRNLSSRRTISVELPEFLIRALEWRTAEANDGASEEERVSLDHLIEVELVGSVSLADVAHLERDVPGISAAVSQWLNDLE